ncbi:gamma-glutamylcyclotransferase [Rhodopirellula sp. JC740]|uniref:Gamma-glutamylcyclotransferase n=1 Tax=Rhodopirellula halodulae TaxID=2894198 RepID=A0ABS8NG86_9BACT|nr:gamma-glutamylcyclotransferase family protein [Rhodopirellula sp. JC740]MCC9642550.1 gamma-glutamylcyclotransferase [Rhodopirellula sp. JC740]
MTLLYSGTIPTDVDPEELSVFFVYGTLCRGQCRERCWPIEPLAVHPAWVTGTLYGRDDYPAMTAGDQRVGGECWFYHRTDANRVTKVLDEIEVTNQPGQPNLYDRVRVTATLLHSDIRLAGHRDLPGRQAKSTWSASTYHYSTDPMRDGFSEIDPGKTPWGDLAVWPPEKWRIERDI